MRRREFIAGLGCAAAWPVTADAQQPVLPVIGYLSGNAVGAGLRPFLQGLNEGGLSYAGDWVTRSIRRRGEPAFQ
jgi:putative tryptophan/tyrosine transport system substrate-binding protein